MAVEPILVEKQSMYELIPVIENWLLEKGYYVDTIANRIDAQKESVYLTIFLENFPRGCMIKFMSKERSLCEELKKYLSIKHLLTNKILCTYCGRETEQSNSKCPFCGGPIN
jgi:hypothetical protein